MNDDIEKRVLVNKDGSLSVEMRVRFRLQNDETLQWSTQIKKSPSLTNECCPLSQAQPQYLQHGQSESCSDPDSTSFDPECMDYSSQHLQHVSEGSHCLCCYQRQKPQYDLWENPAHINSQHPVPPSYAEGHAHTIVRHTHSSSSSSSCNSRRVVRCRARLSKCAGGSGSEQSRLIQEEMCVTEQVERTVEVEQNGDTHVEVCRVSRCSEVVALDSNLGPLSGKSGEDGPTLEDEEKHPVSTVSSSSHVLQLLKEDQDDDLPPSASQCSCRNEPASETASVHSFKNNNSDEADKESRAGSAASVSHSGAATPHSTADTDEMHGTRRSKPPTSRASGRSSKAEAAASETVADDDQDEEIMRVVSGLSGHTDGSLQSSCCPLCGGLKRSVPNSRSSNRSRHSRNASPSNAPPDDDDDASNVSGVSTKSNKTNHSNHDCFSASNVTQSRSCSATSKMSGPETKEEDRATSVKSHRTNTSHKSSCNGSTGDKAGERIPSAMSARSRKSHGSNNNVKINDTNVQTKEELGDDERALSSLSAKTGVSSQTNPSVKLYVLDACQPDSPTVEEDTAGKRPASVLDQTGEMERPDSVLSAKSNASGKTSQSHRSNCSQYGTAESPCADAPDKLQDEGRETEERAASTNSCRSRKASERANSPRSKPEHNSRSVSKMSGRSDKTNASVKSSKSCKSNCNINETVTVNVTEGEEKESEAMEEETQQAESVASSCKSNENQEPTSESRDTPLDPQNEDGLVRATSAMSTKSKSSARSSHRSNSGRNVQVISPNASSGKNSASSHKSSRHGVTDVAAVETADAESCSSECSHGQSLSPKIIRSPKLNSSKVSPTPPSSPQFPVQQLLPDPTVSETRGPSALSVHSVKSVKSGRSKCSCGAASSNKEMEAEEGKDVKNEELSEQPASILSPSTKRLRKESGGTEEPLSRNSSGSISIGLPEDAASSDSWKSSVSGRNRAKTRSPDVAVMEDVDRLSGSILSQKSNFNESKSTHDLPIINIPTIKTPGQSQESGEQNPVRADSAVTSRSSRSRKTCNCSAKSRSSRSASRPTGSHGDELDDKPLSTASSASAQVKKGSKTPEGDSVSRPTSKAKNKDNIENDKADIILSKSPCCLSPDVAPLEDSVKCSKVTPNGSVKTSRSKRKESPIKSSSPCPDPNTKLETCSESTLSQSLSAADLLKETVAAAHPPSHHSKTSKTSNKPRSEKHQGSKNKTPCEDLELTPTCLPNASPNEVVSEWLKNIPTNSSMLDFTDDLPVEEEHEKVEQNPIEEAAEDEGLQDGTADEEEKSKLVEEEENEEEELNVEGAARDTGVPPQPKFLLRSNDSVPRNWQSSAAVMKVLLSSSLGRCQSLPEVRKSSFTQIYNLTKLAKRYFSVF